MGQKLTASLPQGMDLDANYTLQWAALDPATGEDVAGVMISDASMLVTQVSAGTGLDLENDGFVPLLTPLDLEDQAAAVEAEG